MNSIVRLVAKMISPLRNRVSNMVARAVISSVDDGKKVQAIQLGLLSDETRDDVERFQEYGFTSNPPIDSEAVVVFVGGVREHGLAIGVEDRRYRIRNLASGEVAVYDQTGSKIVLKSNGNIELVPSSGTTTITGDVSVSGTLTATTDVVGGGKSLKNHTHTMTPVQSPIAVAGAVGTISGTSGAPV